MNLLGIISQFGRLLPGYIQGERMAVQDNWNDLNQYNQVQSGQIQNAYDEAVFNPRVNMLYDQAELSSLGVDTSRMNYDVNRAMQPGRMFQATSFSTLACSASGSGADAAGTDCSGYVSQTQSVQFTLWWISWDLLQPVQSAQSAHEQ